MGADCTEAEGDLNALILHAGGNDLARGTRQWIADQFDAGVDRTAIVRRLAAARQLNEDTALRRGGDALQWAEDQVERHAVSDTVSPRRLPALKPLSAYEITTPEYLWHPYIQRGAVNLLVGEWAMGKTWVACAIAAALTKGWHLPDAKTGEVPDGAAEASTVLYFTAENTPSTIRFRIERIGGDVERVRFWDTTVEPLPKLTDLAVWDAACTQARPSLVVIDPIQSGLDHRRNIDKVNEVRPMLDALSGLARRHGTAILALGHLNKAAGQQARHRIIGSVDFGAAPRSILMVAPHGAGADERVLVHYKSSDAPTGCALGYAMKGEESSVEFVWTGGLEADVDELLTPPRSDRTDTAVNRAMVEVRDLLRDGPKSRGHVIGACKERGISESAARRAGRVLRVKIGSVGTYPRTTTWALPREAL